MADKGSPIRLKRRFSLALLIALLLSGAVQAAPILVHNPLDNRQTRLPADSGDPRLIAAAHTLCQPPPPQKPLPAYFCLSQIQFTHNQHSIFPKDWDLVLADALRTEMLKSRWLMQRLKVSPKQLQAMSARDFIHYFARDKARAAVLRSWIGNRAKQLKAAKTPLR